MELLVAFVYPKAGANADSWSSYWEHDAETGGSLFPTSIT